MGPAPQGAGPLPFPSALTRADRAPSDAVLRCGVDRPGEARMDGDAFEGNGRDGSAASAARRLAGAVRLREAEADAAAALAALSSLRQRLLHAPASLRRPDAGLAEALARIDSALAETVRAYHAEQRLDRPDGRPPDPCDGG